MGREGLNDGHTVPTGKSKLTVRDRQMVNVVRQSGQANKLHHQK